MPLIPNVGVESPGRNSDLPAATLSSNALPSGPASALEQRRDLQRIHEPPGFGREKSSLGEIGGCAGSRSSATKPRREIVMSGFLFGPLISVTYRLCAVVDPDQRHAAPQSTRALRNRRLESDHADRRWLFGCSVSRDAAAQREERGKGHQREGSARRERAWGPMRRITASFERGDHVPPDALGHLIE